MQPLRRKKLRETVCLGTATKFHAEDQEQAEKSGHPRLGTWDVLFSTLSV